MSSLLFCDFVGDFVGIDLRSTLPGLTDGRRVVLTVDLATVHRTGRYRSC